MGSLIGMNAASRKDDSRGGTEYTNAASDVTECNYL